MKKIFLTSFLFISLFVLGTNSASAFGGWNSGGAQTIHVTNYGYSAPAVYAPASAYVPVQNYGYAMNNNYYGGYNTYMPTYYGNNWNQGFSMGINSGMGMGWNTGGFMPVGYGGSFGGGWNTWGGGCGMYCYGGPIFY